MPSTYQLYYGVDEALPDPIPLRAGPLSLIYANGDLRYIRLGDRELIRRIYVAVRDVNWGTVTNRIGEVELENDGDAFTIRYAVENREGEIDFAWTGRITGTRDGQVRFEMEGVARSSFWRNRLGFCVLHPAACAGAPARIEHVDGSMDEAHFPHFIAQQRIVDGIVKPVTPFEEMAALSHEVSPGVWATVGFEGDIFELEDQRNWTDASFKTYSTPLRLPFPVEVAAGAEVRQAVTVAVQGVADVAVSPSSQTVTIDVDATPAGALPRWGLGMASHGEALTTTETERLRRLNLHHLRVDLRLDDADWDAALRQATAQAAALGARLEVALHFTDDYAAQTAALAVAVQAHPPPVWSWLLFRQGAAVMPQAWVEAVAPVLRRAAPDALIGGGTDIFFTDLNRERPPLDSFDLVAYSINPQVHAFDNASLAETLAAQATTVASARRLIGERRLAVSPVTLRMRFNPNAAGPEPAPLPGQLPPAVDPRQMSLFGAGWTLGSLKYLAESGVDSVTYYETTGWRGVMETEAGSPLPQQFPSPAGAVFPLYHVLADVGEFGAGDLLPARSSDPLAVEALALRDGGRRRVILANLSHTPQRIRLRGLSGAFRLRTLDEQSAIEAMQRPEEFRSNAGEALAAQNGVLELLLKPFAVACLTSS